MNLFNAAFLSTAHGITVIDAHAFNAVNARFELLRITKLTASVCKTNLKNGQEIICTKGMFHLVNGSLYGTFRTTVQQTGNKQLSLWNIKGQNTLIGAFGRQNSIHFKKVVRIQRLKISIGSPDKSVSVFYALFCMLSGFEMRFSFQINVAG